MSSRTETLVIIPTYNEADSILPLLTKIESLPVDVLVIDDNSPDGTANIVDEYAKTHESVKVLRREKKSGLGVAYHAGFNLAKLNKYSYVAQMDADGSHRVYDLRRMLEFLVENPDIDLLIGSRWMTHGQTEGWSRKRVILSRSANAIGKLVLKSSVNDLTSGFKVLSSDAVASVLSCDIQAKGYAFQIESTFLIEKSGFEIQEFPITFVERKSGQSKMNISIILEAIILLTQLGFQHRIVPKWRNFFSYKKL